MRLCRAIAAQVHTSRTTGKFTWGRLSSAGLRLPTAPYPFDSSPGKFTSQADFN
jgi:hypothetical protein